MKKILFCVVAIAFVVLLAPKALSAEVLQTITLQPVARFSVAPDGTINPRGSLPLFGGSPLRDETFQEYDLSGLATPLTATLNFSIRDIAFSTVDIGRTVQLDVSTYAGNGKFDSSDFGTGALLGTFFTTVGVVDTFYSTEVAPVIQSLQSSGATHLGVRFHDPLIVEVNKIDQYTLPGAFDQSLAVTVPEPSAMFLLAVGLGLILPRRWLG